jgi:hypothetical protein
MIVLHNDSIPVRVFTIEFLPDFKCDHSEGDVWKISTDYLKTKVSNQSILYSSHSVKQV